jgi:hypothetical protein
MYRNTFLDSLAQLCRTEVLATAMGIVDLAMKGI